MLEPGQPNALYHSETGEESFLVLAGECLLLVEGEERRLRAWDFVHCPPETAHVFVGAGDGPAVVLMVGARPEDETLRYPVSDLARAYGASVEQESASPEEAYSSVGATPPEPGRPRSWEELPWA